MEIRKASTPPSMSFCPGNKKPGLYSYTEDTDLDPVLEQPVV